MIRQPYRAGSFYPARPETCEAQLEECLREAMLEGEPPAEPVAAIVPHAGWMYSGRVAAGAWASLARRRAATELVVLFGAVHVPGVRRAAMPEAADLIAAEAERSLAVETRCGLLRAVELTGAALRVGQAIAEAYDRAKAAEGALDYDDLIARTDDLLSTPGVADWILYKMDGRVDHILVDEAQDTNDGQWRIIEALCADFFAGAGARETLRTVFAVGDVKQSIYRFQGARPQAFIDARDRVEARAGAARTPFETVALETSFRSTAAVLDLVDAVFADAAASAGLTLDGAPVVHSPDRIGQAGLVELWPVEAKPDRPEAPPWSVADTQDSEDSAEARLAVRIARRIAAMVQDGERLEARDRAIRPRDILVLVRRRTPFVDHLVRKLKILGVPVAGRDRMDVAAQLAVKDVLALVQAALLPEDDYNLAVVLKGPLIGMEEGALFDLAHDRGGESLWARLQVADAIPARPEFRPARRDRCYHPSRHRR